MSKEIQKCFGENYNPIYYKYKVNKKTLFTSFMSVMSFLILCLVVISLI